MARVLSNMQACGAASAKIPPIQAIYGPAYNGLGMLNNGYLSFWAAGMLNPKREDAYPLAVSP
jgi:hypothetical protein